MCENIWRQPEISAIVYEITRRLSNKWRIWSICTSKSPTSANVKKKLCKISMAINQYVQFVENAFISYRNTETFIHLLKSALGTGIFAMPNAFNHAGYVVGIIGTVLLGSIATYCVHMIVNIHYELCKWRKVRLIE